MSSFHFSAHPTYCLVSQYQPSGTGALCSQLKYHTDCKIPYMDTSGLQINDRVWKGVICLERELLYSSWV